MPIDFDIGDGADALGRNQLSDALDGTYWVSGWDATLGAGDLEVDIAAGDGAVDGTDVSTGSTQTIDFTGDPDSTDPRKAVIYVDNTGTVQKALGTPQPVDPTGEIRFRTYNPSPPASVSGVVVAEVWLAAGETVLESADVRDRRVSNQAAASATDPLFMEDGNSPITFSGVSSVTYTPGTAYDIYEVYFKIENDTNSFFLLDLQVNGDTGSNYEYTTSDGVEQTGQDGFDAFAEMRDSDTAFVQGDLTLSGTWDPGAWVEDITQARGQSTGDKIEMGYNAAVTGPLSQFTIKTPQSVTFSGTIEVFGRNIE